MVPKKIARYQKSELGRAATLQGRVVQAFGRLIVSPGNPLGRRRHTTHAWQAGRHCDTQGRHDELPALTFEPPLSWPRPLPSTTPEHQQLQRQRWQPGHEPRGHVEARRFVLKGAPASRGSAAGGGR